jgi:glutamine synthetase
MAEELGKFADVLESAEDFDSALQKLICDTLTQHQRIIFNGNGYSMEWQEEAARRGLSNLRSTAKALPTYISQKNIDLVTKRGIFTEAEFRARYEIHMASYSKIIRIEAKTMVDMVLQQILPAGLKYSSDLSESVLRKQQLKLRASSDWDLVRRISRCCDTLYTKTEEMAAHLRDVPTGTDAAANYYSDVIVPDMEEVRKSADLLERLTAKSYWPYPIYSDILYY